MFHVILEYLVFHVILEYLVVHVILEYLVVHVILEYLVVHVILEYLVVHVILEYLVVHLMMPQGFYIAYLYIPQPSVSSSSSYLFSYNWYMLHSYIRRGCGGGGCGGNSHTHPCKDFIFYVSNHASISDMDITVHAIPFTTQKQPNPYHISTREGGMRNQLSLHITPPPPNPSTF